MHAADLKYLLKLVFSERQLLMVIPEWTCIKSSILPQQSYYENIPLTRVEVAIIV